MRDYKQKRKYPSQLQNIFTLVSVKIKISMVKLGKGGRRRPVNLAFYSTVFCGFGRVTKTKLSTYKMVTLNITKHDIQQLQKIYI